MQPIRPSVHRADSTDTAAPEVDPVRTSAGSSTLILEPALLTNGDAGATGDLGAQIAALLVETASRMKKSSRDERALQEVRMEKAEEGQLAAIWEQADHVRAAGVWEGVGGLLEGGCRIASGSLAIASAAGSAHAKMAENLSKITDGSGTTSSALGRMLGSGEHARGVTAEGNARQYEQAAGHAKRATDELRDDEHDAEAMVKKALDFYREFATSQSQAQSAAVHRA